MGNNLTNCFQNNPDIYHPKVSLSEIHETTKEFDKQHRLNLIESFKGIRVVVDPRLTGCCFYICGSQELVDLLKDGVSINNTFSHNEKL